MLCRPAVVTLFTVCRRYLQLTDIALSTILGIESQLRRAGICSLSRSEKGNSRCRKSVLRSRLTQGVARDVKARRAISAPAALAKEADSEPASGHRVASFFVFQGGGPDLTCGRR